MNTKAITRSTAALLVIVIVLVAAFGGYVFMTQQAPPTPPGPGGTTIASTTAPALPTPSFVTSNTYVQESANQFQWLDPAVSYYQYDYDVMNNVYEPLLWYNGNSSTQIIPWLASDYSQTSPTQYVFHLRQNITFQDGRHKIGRAHV